jgi:ribonuclease HI
MRTISIIVDGSPNRVAIVYKKGDLNYHNTYPIDQSTNNESELKAILIGLQKLPQFYESSRETSIEIFSDSNNAIQWCAKTFKCKEPRLITIRDAILELAKTFGKVTFTWLPDNIAGKMLERK